MADGVRRVGVIGDVHACDERLEGVLELLQGEGLERIVCVGDVVSGPGDPDRCAELLTSAGVVTVRGNHDRWLLEGTRLPGDPRTLADHHPETVAFLRSLPATVELEAAAGEAPLLLCHGLAGNDMNGITADDYGYALDMNDELQALQRTQLPWIVLKGHRHAPRAGTSAG